MNINKDMRKQFIKYILVGGSTAAFELGVFTILRRAAHMDVAPANVIAVIMSTSLNFALNRGWAFKAASNLSRSIILYLILFFFNMTFTTSAISIMVGWNVPDIFAKLITMGMVTIWNYVIYRKIIFK